MNLDNLRRKRVHRLGVKTSNHAGQRRIFFILDRATRKFHGDLGLWMQYLTFARKQRSTKKVSQILTSMLRLHPTKPELWIYAANYAVEEKGDMNEARSHMQRALRFCRTEEKLWVEYARLEMMWIAKMVRRREILGLDTNEIERRSGDPVVEFDGDEVALPNIPAEDCNPNQRPRQGVDDFVLEKLETSPALSGAIPIAIYDSAMKQFKDNEKLRLDFYDMTAEFPDLPCSGKVSNHIMEAMKLVTYESPETLIRFIQQPVMSHSVISYGFPSMFGLCLGRMKDAFKRLVSFPIAPKTARPRSILDRYIIEWMLSYLGQQELDPDVQKVIFMNLRKVWTQYQEDITGGPEGRAAEVATLIGKLQAHGLLRIAEAATAWATEQWPDETQLFS